MNGFHHIYTVLYYTMANFRLPAPDALLADLENTGSPLAQCPVLLTSDPPKNSDPTTEDTSQGRPPPPAYTPQQVTLKFYLNSINFANKCSLWPHAASVISSSLKIFLLALRLCLLQWNLPRTPTQTNYTGNSLLLSNATPNIHI